MSYRPPLIVSLLMRRGPQPNRVFPLDKEIITIGRGPDNDIVIDDAEVSRHHARLTRRGHDWILEDLGSRNGTFVNGQRIVGPAVLTPGAQVGLGSHVLFGLEMGLPAAPAPPAPRPPRRRKRGFNWLLVAAPAAIVLLLGVLAILLYWRQQEQARAEFEPPTVLVTEPLPGVSAFAGSYLAVSATAFGRKPITRAELWLDGELKETQNSYLPGGESTFYASFNLLVPEGPHMLFVRAVNTAGIVGQSYPVSVVGAPKPGPGEVFYAVHVNTGETLADIARSYDTDPATLQKVNPNLGGQEPAAGMVIQVPIPPEEQAPAPTPPPPPAPLPGSAPVPVPNVPPLKVLEPSPIPVDWGLPVAFLAIKPPAAPSSLQAQVKDCQVTLSWNDNATNEERYEVWIAGLGLPPRVIAKLKPASGPAWFEFPAPQPGFFSFWVVAANFLGGQPSNVVWVSVEPKCPTTVATHLQVEVLDMTVGGSYDRVYCYVSFEGTPETRLPVNPNAFIKVQAGKGDIPAKAPSAVPIPADGALEISGECWGWSGKTLNKLGSFSGQFAVETWDGARRLLEGGGFQIGIAIKPLGAMDTRGTYADRSPGLPPGGTPGGWIPEYTAGPTLPAPYNLRVEEIPGYPYWRRLRWDWAGDEKAIDGFRVLMRVAAVGPLMPAGQWESFSPVSSATREDVVLIGCGDYKTEWQVVAIWTAGQTMWAESKPSETVTINLPPCQVYVQARFDKITLWNTDDSPGYCDTLEVYYQLSLNGVTKSFYGGNSFIPMKCGTYGFGGLGQASNVPQPDTIIVPIYTEDIDIVVKTKFWDYDDWGDDVFGTHSAHIWFPSLGTAQKQTMDLLGCEIEADMGVIHDDDANSWVGVYVSVWPNTCGKLPPGMVRPPGSPP